MKTCTVCKLELPLDMFWKNARLKDGLNHRCKTCSKKAKENSERKLKESDPELWEARNREYREGYRSRHPGREESLARTRNLRIYFGITPEQYDEMLAAQEGTCAVCGSNPGSRRLAIDHDRSCCPGKKSCGACIRQLLCGNCNTALGLLKDNPEYMQGLLDYVKKHKRS